MGTPDGMGIIAVACIVIGFAVGIAAAVFCCKNGRNLWKEGRKFFALLNMIAGFALLASVVIGMILICGAWLGLI